MHSLVKNIETFIFPLFSANQDENKPILAVCKISLLNFFVCIKVIFSKNVEILRIYMYVVILV